MAATAVGAARPLPRRAYAGLVSRVAGLSIDVATVSLAAIAVRVVPETAWTEILNRPAPRWLTFGAGLLATLLPWLYFTTSWWLVGQTLGALAIGVVVVRRNGEELGLLHAAARAAVGLTFAPLWLVGLVPVLWDERRRAWLDLLFRTEVRYTHRKNPTG